MKKMNPVEFVQTTINSSNLSLNQWSKELSLSRQTIYNWLGNIDKNDRKNEYVVIRLYNCSNLI